MAVVVETTLGDITIDLYTKERPRACLNFLKLCKMKYYNYNLFHMVGRDFIAQTGDPTGSRKGGESIFGVLEGPLKRYFEAETHPRIKHTISGLVSFVGAEDNMIGSQFFITLAADLTYLDDRHCVFGEVAEGLDVLELLNDAICDNDNRPYQDIRITHTVVLDDPYPDLPKLKVPSRSPSPSAKRLQGGRIAPDEEIDETTGKDIQEIEEMKAEREAKARATILEMVGDIPDAEMAPPENVLFVCKLNPVTTDDDLEIIFSRFGKINSCEVIRDRKTGDSLQYAFIEFDDCKACEDAYFKMDNVLIDDRRIHVDFSQSVAKVKWLGKGRGVAHFDDKGRRTEDKKNDIGQGNYKGNKNRSREENWEKKPAIREKPSKDRNRERSSLDRDRSSEERDRSSRDRDISSRDRGRSSGDRERSSWDRERFPRDQQKFSRNQERSPRDRQRSPRNQERSPRDQERSSKDRQGSSRDRQGSPRDQQRYSRDQERSPKDRQGSSRDRQGSPRDQQRSSRDRQRFSRNQERSPRDQQRSPRNQDRSPRDQQRSSRDQQRSPMNQERSPRDQQRYSRDQERSPRAQQRSSRDRQGSTRDRIGSPRDQRSSRDRQRSPRNQERSLRDQQSSSKDRQRSPRYQERSPRDQHRSSRDRQRSPRYQERFPRDQQRFSRGTKRFSRGRQRSPRNREASRDGETFKRYKPSFRSDQRTGWYPEERRERMQYRPYPMQNRRPQRNSLF